MLLPRTFRSAGSIAWYGRSGVVLRTFRSAPSPHAWRRGASRLRPRVARVLWTTLLATRHTRFISSIQVRRSPPQGRRAHPRARQREGPGGYKLSRSDDEGDVGRDGVSGSERNLQQADSACPEQKKRRRPIITYQSPCFIVMAGSDPADADGLRKPGR